MTTAAGVPEMSLGDDDLPKQWYDELLEMRVEVGYRTASRAVLRFRDPYYELSGQERVRMGRPLQVTVRWTSDADVLFDGEVTAMAVESHLGAAPELVVTAHDRAYRLARGRMPRTYVDASLDAVVSDVARRHGLTPRVTAPSLVMPHVMQVDTDLALVDALADRTGCDWWVDGQTLHFAERPSSPAEPSVELVMGQNLVRLSVRAVALPPDQLVVQGWDSAKQTAVVAPPVSIPRPKHPTDHFAHAFYPPTQPGVPPPPNLHVGGAAASTVAEAKLLAGAVRDEAVHAAVTVTGTALRGGKLRPGSTVEVQQAGPSSGRYCISAVEHVFRTRLETRFTAGPRRPATLLDTVGGAVASRDLRRRGLVTGKVTNVKDPDKVGRVKVVLSGVKDDHETHWARVLSPGGGAGHGFVMLPSVDDEVLVAFDTEGSGEPVVLGGLHSKKSPPATCDVDDRGTVIGSRWTADKGHVIELRKEDQPAKQHILLELHGAQHRLRLGKDAVELVAPAGVPLSLKVGGNSSLVFDGNGNVTLKGVNVTIEADGNLTASGKGTVALESKTGTTTVSGVRGAALKSPAKVEVESSLVTTVKGATVQIN